MATGSRPWRAIAYLPDPVAGGRKREVVGRTSAGTRPGLDRFITDHETAGHVLDVWQVLTIDTEVTR